MLLASRYLGRYTFRMSTNCILLNRAQDPQGTDNFNFNFAPYKLTPKYSGPWLALSHSQLVIMNEGPGGATLSHIFQFSHASDWESSANVNLASKARSDTQKFTSRLVCLAGILFIWTIPISVFPEDQWHRFQHCVHSWVLRAKTELIAPPIPNETRLSPFESASAHWQAL